MKKGYCIDCEGIALLKARNRCEHHYRRYYYIMNRERELAYARQVREARQREGRRDNAEKAKE